MITGDANGWRVLLDAFGLTTALQVPTAPGVVYNLIYPLQKLNLLGEYKAKHNSLSRARES